MLYCPVGDCCCCSTTWPGFGGGGGGICAAGVDVGEAMAAVLVAGPRPSGNGGTGGGVGMDSGGCGAGFLYFTGGSVAKTSRRMNSRSTRVDFCPETAGQHSTGHDIWIKKRKKGKEKLAYIPGLHPVRKIVMIHPALQRNMLPNPDHHIMRWGHVDHRGFARIARRNPYFDGEFVQGPAKRDR